MAKRKAKNDGILFCGMNADDVTGSQCFISFGDKKILLECGLYQSKSNSYIDAYKVNSEKFKFNPSELDYVFICHSHIDHVGLLPRLIKEGFKGKIIATGETAIFATALLLNSQFLLEEEARILTKRYKRNYSPIYSESDTYKTLDYIYVYENYNQIYKLDETVSFQWLENSHCVGAAQLQLILTHGYKTKKILYTSDIGALKPINHYVNNTVIPEMFNDITIMESTYGDRSKLNKKTRDFDIEHLRVAIETVLERKGSLVFPAFSYSRSQEILTVLYELFHDKDFKYEIVVDSKLTCEISDLYQKSLSGDNKKLWNKVYNWENVKFISEKKDSQSSLADNKPKICISSSGFCTNGRILNYLEKYLRDEKSMIVFSGYVGDNPSYLSYRIKNYKDNKKININKKAIPNKADCITLSTFSSHANHNDLVKYGSSLNTEKLILVHGSDKSKNDLKEALKPAISKNNRSYKVLCSSKEMYINL